MLQNRILSPQPLQLGMQIDRDLTRLLDIPFLPEPPRQHRQADAQILRYLPPRPATGQCKPHRFTPKL
jgi:hypothetical protein